MKWVVYILTLLRFRVAAQEDDWMNWAVSIKLNDSSEFCNGVLVTYSHALSTCECATHPDFVFPEFLRKTAGQFVVEIRENQEGFQSRKVLRFDPHPKCTSNYFVQGFLAYNFAIVATAEPFQRTKFVHPIGKWRLNSVEVTRYDSKCTLMGRKSRSLISPFPINVLMTDDCSERASLALGSKPINFEEKGMMCADLGCNNTSGICDNNDSFGANTTDFQPANNSSVYVQHICDGIVVTGAPVVCDGKLAGLVSHGICKLHSVPVIVSRIELTNSLIDGLSLGVKPASPQPLLKISATVVILRNL